MRDALEAFRARHRVPAVGAAIRTGDDRTCADVVGVTHRGSVDTVRVSDAWHIGSCAKSLTAALYACLVEDGRATWGARLPDLFADARGSIDPAWSAVTIDDLFLCRSGLRANPTRSAMIAAYDDGRPAVEQRSDALAALADPPRGRGRFRYSNLGYVLAGAAIDRVAGEPFESVLCTRLLGPLGVTTSGFGPPPRIWGHRPRLQLGGVALGRGDACAPTGVRSDNPALLTPAGRLHLSLPDWARVHRLFLDGAGVLAPTSVDHLMQLPADGRGMGMGWAAARNLPGVAFGMQGSNTFWAATALMSDDRQRIVMVVTNDGRTRLLRSTALLAAQVLRDAS